LGEALCELATTHRLAGDHDQATRDCLQALRILRQAHARFREAMALVELGHIAADTGKPATARQHWQVARHILDDLGVPETEEVRALLGRSRP
jgi:tetratricopeptide (TPR) repeat protein